MTFLLSVLVFSPLLGILLLLLTSKQHESNLKMFGFIGTVPPLLVSLILYQYNASGASLADFTIKNNWIRFGNLSQYDAKLFTVDYELAIDGFSLVLVLMTALLTSLAAFASHSIKKEWKGYFVLLLFLEIGMLGVFTAQNLVLFFLFFELTLISAFFLVGKWGFAEKEKAAYSFLLYNGIGSAILLIVIMILFARAGTTNIQALTHIITIGGVPTIAPISGSMKYALLVGLVAAFAIKLPIFPMHRWMVMVHVEAPTPIVMLHAGVLLKIGAYGMIRFGMGIFPEQFKSVAIYLAVLGVINFLYGAFMAFIQTDFKRVLAYSSISHMGVVLIGLGSLQAAGVQGAVFQVVSHGLIAALLFYLVGIIQEKTDTSLIPDLGGLAKTVPRLSGWLLAGSFASLGLPGMSGFVSEFLAFLGLFKSEPWLAAIGSIGIVMTAVYMLRAVLDITFGKENEKYEHLTDLNWLQQIPAGILLLLIVSIGVYPSLLGEPLQRTLDAIMIGIGR